MFTAHSLPSVGKMHAQVESRHTLTRLLDLVTLSIGVCVVTFLYLPSVVLAFAVGRLGNATLGHAGENTVAIAWSATLRGDEPKRVAVVPDKG